MNRDRSFACRWPCCLTTIFVFICYSLVCIGLIPGLYYFFDYVLEYYVSHNRTYMCSYCNIEDESCDWYGVINDRKSSATKNVFVYNQRHPPMHPPTECSMGVYIYRNISDFDLVLGINKETCEKFTWVIHFMSNKTESLQKIFTNFDRNNFEFLDENNAKLPRSRTPKIMGNYSQLLSFNGDFFSADTQKEMDFISETLLDPKKQTWFSYIFCDKCQELEVINNDVCDTKRDTMSLISGLYWASSACTIFLWIIIFVPCCIYFCRLCNNFSNTCFFKFAPNANSDEDEEFERRSSLFLGINLRSDERTDQEINEDEKRNLLTPTSSQTQVLLIPEKDDEAEKIVMDHLTTNPVPPTMYYQSGDLSTVNNLPKEMVCVICMEYPRNCLIVDCSHACCCVNCIRQILLGDEKGRKCPICRTKIKKGAKKIFLV